MTVIGTTILSNLIDFVGSANGAIFINAMAICGAILAILTYIWSLRTESEGKVLHDASIASINHLNQLAINQTEIHGALNLVDRSLSTYRIAESPYYIPILVNMIREAKKSLEISSLYPTIGVFSDQKLWEHLRAVIESKALSDEFTITATFASKESRRTALRIQFEREFANWPDWSQKRASAKLMKFIAHYGYEKDCFSTPDEFVDFSIEVQNRVINELFCGIEVIHTHDLVTVSSWIIDDSAAVFAFVNSVGRTTGFVTRDSSMIEALRGISARYAPVK